MTEQYFKDKWQHGAREMYAGLMDLDTFDDTVMKVGTVRVFSLVSDLKKVFTEMEEYEMVLNIQSIEHGLKDGLEMV